MAEELSEFLPPPTKQRVRITIVVDCDRAIDEDYGPQVMANEVAQDVQAVLDSYYPEIISATAARCVPLVYVIADRFKEFDESKARMLIVQGRVRVNGIQILYPAARVVTADRIELALSYSDVKVWSVTDSF